MVSDKTHSHYRPQPQSRLSLAVTLGPIAISAQTFRTLIKDGYRTRELPSTVLLIPNIFNRTRDHIFRTVLLVFRLVLRFMTTELDSPKVATRKSHLTWVPSKNKQVR